MKLIIGNKTYSSWSLRPWLLLRQAEIPFEEECVSFNDPDFTAKVKRHSPAGKVPVLVDADLSIWDSLAIVEYVAERFPDKQLWPEDRRARAVARSICAEMHSSFTDLRSQMTMHCTRRFPGLGWNVRVQKDIDRICAIWRDCRDRFGAGGPFLFGRFGIADAYFAPVTRRFVTYDVKLPDHTRQYVETIQALAAMREWIAGAEREDDFVPEDEPYRDGPGQ